MLTVDFVLDGQRYTAINGGPDLTFGEAISLLINCTDQDEVDHYWTKLSEGGEEGQCGWLKDRFGLSWQVCPAALGELLGDPDQGRSPAGHAGHAGHEEDRRGGAACGGRCGLAATQTWRLTVMRVRFRPVTAHWASRS